MSFVIPAFSICCFEKAEPLNLTLRDIFLALAKEVPNPDGGNTLVTNPYETWKDVTAALSI